ncbi:Choline transporter BetT, short form [Nitrincola lacisaponensis]|uniref:Choline transporter BetT, short form n=1 Tax=Nitrincola lacisaponensis TaxID=267850 RepID=A0A063Y4Y8_9GAMM|nr:BCCT family transporter [Nitrincola lacisaponensis]KDE39831.1 Choline transporter BetT, short form [Nitrincola lacisaponensis]
MQMILSIAFVAVLVSAVLIVLRWGDLKCKGTMPVSLFTFIAILFTSGLDVGLIMFPLTEFPVYAEDSAYAFTNPLAIEFGFWGFLVWGLYFLTTFYFCVVEPRLKLFEIPVVKIVNNFVIITTCAFTGFLFLSYLPDYIEGISDPVRYLLVAAVVMAAVMSSTDIKYVKILSVSSTWLFFALIAAIWFSSGMGVGGLASSLSNVGGYFSNLHRFVTPITEYHEFYLFWWFAWSIMIGQFVARFVGGLKAWQLLVALLVFPSIPLAIWFAVLYFHFVFDQEIIGYLRMAMVVVGIIFVINSLDSLIRLYTENLGMTVERFGKPAYILGNWTLMYGIILLYQFTPFEIQWVGLVVITLYMGIYSMLFLKREDVQAVVHRVHTSG